MFRWKVSNLITRRVMRVSQPCHLHFRVYIRERESMRWFMRRILQIAMQAHFADLPLNGEIEIRDVSRFYPRENAGVFALEQKRHMHKGIINRMENNGDIDRRFAIHSGASVRRRCGANARLCATPGFTFTLSTHLSFYELISCHICRDSAPVDYISRNTRAGREIITALRDSNALTF